jgi:hypothetical protein
MKTAACLCVLMTVSTAVFAAEPAEFIGESNCRVAKPWLKPNETVKWEGPCKGGYADGTGVLQWYLQGRVFDTPGARYEVTMAQGRISGEGSAKYKNGDSYTGYFMDGKRDGNGYTMFANGDQYEGEYKNDVPHGNGTFVERDRGSYVGQWKDGQYDGIGTRTYALGGRYEGAWKACKFDGKGVLTFAGSGRRLEAQFEDGRVRGSAAPAKPTQERHAIKYDDAPTGSNITENQVTGDVPFGKPYAALTPAQQAAIKHPYVALEDGDEPPYPINGLKPIFDWIKQAQGKLLIEGDLMLYVLVGKDGNAVSVTIVSSPNPDMAKFAALVVTKEKYKPAVCHGLPCEMIFPFSMKFVVD